MQQVAFSAHTLIPKPAAECALEFVTPDAIAEVGPRGIWHVVPLSLL